MEVIEIMVRTMVGVCAYCGRPIYEGDEDWSGIVGEYCSVECADKAESGEDYYDDDEYYDEGKIFW